MTTRTAIYIRVSTQRQAEEGDSLESQLEDARNFIRLKRWGKTPDELVFEEAGRSGKTLEGRPAMQAALAAAGSFDRLLVWKMSRFARNARDTLNLIYEFQAQGVEVVFVKDMLDTGNPNHKMIITILAAVAQMEVENIGQQSTRGQESAAQKGRWVGGPAPFGYDVHHCPTKGHCDDNKRLEINEEQATVIRSMVGMIVDGQSTTDVQRHLNADGTPTPSDWKRAPGKRRAHTWKSEEVRRSLEKTSLKGEIYWGKTKHGKRYPVKAEPIISPTDWDELQRVLKLGKLLSGHDRTTKAVLSGIVCCSCGGLLTRVGRRHGTYRYRCNNHVDGRCDWEDSPGRPKYWDGPKLEQEAWELVMGLLHSEDVIEDQARQVLGLQEDDGFDQERYDKLTATHDQLIEARRLVQADAYQARAAGKDFDDRLIEVFDERLAPVVAEIELMDVTKESKVESLALLEAWMDSAAAVAALEDLTDPQSRRQLLVDLNVRLRILSGSERDDQQRSVSEAAKVPLLSGLKGYEVGWLWFAQSEPACLLEGPSRFTFSI